jgi:glycosyltransferase involved in cell wall biosynthesis
MSIDISIIIPTYKRPLHLRRALSSVKFESSDIRIEFIVIDDCDDYSGQTEARSANAVYVAKGGRNKGQSISRNIGLRIASGHWIYFLDDDDYAIPRNLSELFNARKPNSEIICGDYIRQFCGKVEYKSLGEITLDRLLVYNFIPIGSFIFRRECFRHSFDETLRSHEDWDFLLRNFLKSKFEYIPIPVVVIDNGEPSKKSVQAERRSFFWMDYLSVYFRFPAPHLQSHRKQALQNIGVNVMNLPLDHID